MPSPANFARRRVQIVPHSSDRLSGGMMRGWRMMAADAHTICSENRHRLFPWVMPKRQWRAFGCLFLSLSLSLSLSLLISNFIETLHFKPRGLFIHGLLRRFIVESEWFMKRGFKGGPLSSSLNTTSFRSGLHSIWRHLNDISILNTLWTGAASHCQHQIGVTHPGFTPNWGGES